MKIDEKSRAVMNHIDLCFRSNLSCLRAASLSEITCLVPTILQKSASYFFLSNFAFLLILAKFCLFDLSFSKFCLLIRPFQHFAFYF